MAGRTIMRIFGKNNSDVSPRRDVNGKDKAMLERKVHACFEEKKSIHSVFNMLHDLNFQVFSERMFS